ncbi:MAG: sugar phosphate isomerase/epimerase [Chloroflexi bacterium]|nr:sugar phosphate isomerase/epimerase [Chloroflexota bacterium]
MKLCGHTLGTPQFTVPESLRLFHSADMDAAEIIWQNEYAAAIPETASESEIAQVRHLAQDLGLSIACLTPYMTGINSLDDQERECDLERFGRCIRAAEQLDCHRIRVYAGSYLEGEETTRDVKWNRLVESLKHLGGIAQQAGVVLCVENHFNTMTVTAVETAALMRAMNLPSVGILYDQANLTFTHGEPFLAAIDLQRPWIRHVHVKDLVFTNPAQKFSASQVATVKPEERAVYSRVVGEGILDWRAILRELDSIGYADYLSFEYEYRWHPQDLPEPLIGFAKSAQVVRDMLAKLDHYPFSRKA